MGALQRRKGANGDREIVNIFKAKGIPAKRISMMETGGIDKGDVLIAEVWKAECKVGMQVPDFVYKARKAGEELLLMKRDRKQWLICMDLELFLDKFI